MTIKEQPVVWFMIPVADLDRAIGFYNAAFGLNMEAMAFEEEQTAFFPVSEDQAGGMLSVDRERAGRNGVILYLNGGDNLAPLLDRISAAGGKVTMPKTDVGQSMGFYAHFMDSEGNEVGLWSPA
jgi:uncharacterized protein